jgi:anti-sigma factor ChrR (cupin superfamily)
MLSEEFWELTALYALDSLDEPKRRVVEDAIAKSPELQAQLAKFKKAISAIPYSAPPVSMAADLKKRLFERIASLEPNSAQWSVTTLRERLFEVSWESYSIPGVMVSKLSIDDEMRQIAYFVRAEAGIQFPAHRHASDEEIIVLEGNLRIGGKIYSSGDRIYSTPGSCHQPETLEGCTLFLCTSLDDEIVELNC